MAKLEITTDKDHLIKLKLVEILRPLLKNEDLAKLLQPEPFKILRQAFVHKYASAVNYEVLELVGDKMNSFALALWMKQTFPEEQREANFSRVVAKVLSTVYLARWSEKLGLPSLIIKPNQKDFPITDNDKEDVFEALMGAIVLASEQYLVEGVGSVLVKEIVTPFFVLEKIDPANVTEYIDAVSLLKMATNTLYNTEPLYNYRETKDVVDGKDIIFFTAEVIKVVRLGNEFKKTQMAYLDIDQAQRSKKEAKEEVSRLALKKEGWTFEFIEEEREKKNAKNLEKYMKRLEDEIKLIRDELAKTMRIEVVEKVVVYKPDSKKVIGITDQVKKKISLDKYIEEKYGVETAAKLKLPVKARLESDKIDKKNKNSDDIAVLLFTANSKGDLIERGGIRVKKNQVHQAYFKLVKIYTDNLKKDVGLLKFELQP